MTRRFRYVLWTLKRVESIGVDAHITCVSGTPACGAEPPVTPEGLAVDGIAAWAEHHLRMTGHRRYDRVIRDTVQWDPPEDTDPRHITGVST
ncbi:hypothetical protein AAFN69_27575 [Streptomyces sp. CAU 1734]